MGLLTRLTTLAKADAHGVVDALEDKALVLRQHVREAGAELDRKRCRVAALDAECKDLGKDRDRMQEQIGRWESDVDLALAEDQGELVRYTLKKLLPLRHAVPQLEHRIETLDEKRREIEHQLAEQQAEFELLEQRVRGYLARHGEDGSSVGFTDMVVTDEDVEIELLRRQAESRRQAEQGDV